ncbi:MAG: DNA polymerase I [Spirochaetes bacterium]|nr:DNA polymerase I [Spirochaetota bacterium]
MENQNKKIILVDGHSIIYKIHFSMIKTPLFTTNNENVTIINGFLTKIFSIIEKFKPEYIAIIFDSKEKTFRHEIFPSYKETRNKAPEEINRQTPIIIDLLNKLNFFTLIIPGYEADDIIAYISNKVKTNSNITTYIYSSDKDLMQLVDDRTFMIASGTSTKEEIIIDRNEVYKKFGVYPEQITDFLALIGDSSDNIPGVIGIGEKTARDLLNKYKTLDNIYKYINTIESKKVAEKLLLNKDKAYLSKKLVILNNEIPYNFSIEDFKIPTSFSEESLNILKKYELKKLYEKITNKPFDQVAELKTIDNSKYYLIETEEDLNKILKKIKNNNIKYIALDTETTGFNFQMDEIIGVSFSFLENEAYYVSLLKENKNNLLLLIKSFVEDENIFIIGHNIKFDYKVLKKYDIEIKNIFFDTIIAAKLFLGDAGKLNLDYLAEKYLRYKTIHYDDIVKEKGYNLSNYPIEKVKDYSCEDADVTLKLYNKFKKLLDDYNLSTLFYKIEMPLIKILAHMEINGILVDESYFLEKKKTIENMLNELEKEIYKIAGEEFTINSPKQLQKILFEKLNLPPVKKGKTGYSTDEDVLEELSNLHLLPAKIIEWRKLSKLYSTYIIPILNLKDMNNRLHTNYNQVFVTTGRLSSNDPNLQNIPVYDDYNINIRKGFISKENFTLISADYSQIELRVLAHFSKDENLINAFINGEDIHKSTASFIFNKKIDEITPKERNIAKTINFGVIYGLSPFGLSQQLKISRGEASNFINKYFSQFNRLKKYEEELISFVREYGYTYTLFGRRRYIPEIRSNNKVDQQMGARIALNTQIQGTAAEIMKIATIQIYDFLTQTYREKAYLLRQIHDEIILEIEDSFVEKIKLEIKEIMENLKSELPNFIVPLKVNISSGKDWGQLKD